jgi:hypothetical protein
MCNIKTVDGREGRDIDELLSTIQHELKSETRAVGHKKMQPTDDRRPILIAEVLSDLKQYNLRPDPVDLPLRTRWVKCTT